MTASGRSCSPDFQPPFLLSVFYNKIKSTRCGEESSRTGHKPKTEEPNCVSDENHDHTEIEEKEPMRLWTRTCSKDKRNYRKRNMNFVLSVCFQEG